MEIELKETNHPDPDVREAESNGETVVRPRVRIHDLLQRPFDTRSIATTGLFLLAVFYTMYFVRSLLLPIVLALLLSYLLRPIVRGLAKIRIHPLLGSARPTLKLIIEQVAPKTDTSHWDRLTKERRAWDRKLDQQADLARSADRIHPQAVARAVSDLANRDAVFVLDTGLNTLWSANWIRQSGSQRIIGSFNNAAVGTALGQANGIQAFDRTRQVIALTGDGGFNMLMCEFLTAAHHKLPVKAVIYNNAAFGLIRLEAESIGVPPYRQGIDFPNPDFAAFARACGGHGFAARKPDELKKAISDALAVDGPAIVDAMVVANELPNVPHLDLELLGQVARAKIKEAVLAVTGG